MVLDVAGAALGIDDERVDRPLALELAQDRLVRPADRVGERVEAAAVRHPDHDLVRAVGRGELDRLVEHRHERRRALRARTASGRGTTCAGTARVPQPARGGGATRSASPARAAPEAPRLDRLPQPDALGVVGDVLDLVRDRAAVDLAQPRQRLEQGVAGDVEAQQPGGDPRLQLRRQRRARGASRRAPDRPSARSRADRAGRRDGRASGRP